jgi:hypothetical protein
MTRPNKPEQQWPPTSALGAAGLPMSPDPLDGAWALMERLQEERAEWEASQRRLSPEDQAKLDHVLEMIDFLWVDCATSWSTRPAPRD